MKPLPWWKAVFQDGTAVYLEAESSEAARLLARLQAWSASGKWFEVQVQRAEGQP